MIDLFVNTSYDIVFFCLFAQKGYDTLGGRFHFYPDFGLGIRFFNPAGIIKDWVPGNSWGLTFKFRVLVILENSRGKGERVVASF